jgi:tRNA dimethylallyltransferase
VTGGGGAIGFTITLRVEETGQIGVVEADGRLGRNDRLGMKRDPQSRRLQHCDIVGAVADCDRPGWRHALFGGERQQSLAFALCGEYRRLDPAGEQAVGNLQPIGDDAVKAEFGADGVGKYRKSAGHECGHGAGAVHRRDQCPGAVGKADPTGGSREDIGFGPGEQSGARGKGFAKIDLASHRAAGDRRDLGGDSEQGAQFVEHFIGDNRRFEIGDEQPLAPQRRRLNHDIDRGAAENGAHACCDRLRLGQVDKKIAGLMDREPNRLGCDRQRRTDLGGKPDETGVGGGRDQRDGESHRRPSYAAGGASNKPRHLPPVVVVAGPTASGKSALALALSEAYGGTVINADAMQCYRDLAILTVRPDAAAESRVPHRLYGYLDAAERGSVGDWRPRALAEIAAAAMAGRLPIVTGGTGLYLHALQHGIAPFPPIPAAIRDEAAALHRALGGAAFRDRLAAIDPASAARLPPGDTQRLLRAYAVARGTGRPLAIWREQAHAPAPYRFATILIMPPREALYAACDARFRLMLERGALAEAAALAGRGLDPGLPAMKAVGLPELLTHLSGETTLAEATVAAQRATRRYAKRQMTWFRHQSHPDLVVSAQYSESLLQCSRQFIDALVLTTSR